MACYLYLRLRHACHAAHPARHTFTDAGDAICAVPKPWNFGKLEMASPDHAWIEIADLDADAATLLFCGHEGGDGEFDVVGRPRAGGFDLQKLPPQVHAYLARKPVVVDLEQIKAAPSFGARAATLVGKGGHDHATAAEEMARILHRDFAGALPYEHVKRVFDAVSIPVVLKSDLLAAYGEKPKLPDPFDSGVNPFDVVLPKPEAR